MAPVVIFVRMEWFWNSIAIQPFNKNGQAKAFDVFRYS